MALPVTLAPNATPVTLVSANGSSPIPTMADLTAITQLAPSTDFNTVRTTGRYYTADNVSTNTPAGFPGFWWLEVQAATVAGAPACRQDARSLGGAPTGTWTRVLNGNGDFAEWLRVEIASTGATAQRPTIVTGPLPAGTQHYDTTLGKPIWYNGTVWKDAAGVTV